MPRSVTSLFIMVLTLTNLGATSTSIVLFSDYFPIAPQVWGKKTFMRTFGQGGQFTSEIIGKITVPYRSGAVSGVRVTNTNDASLAWQGISNDGNSVIFNIAAGTAAGDVGYGSTDCSVSTYPPFYSFSVITEGMLVDVEPFKMVAKDLSQCNTVGAKQKFLLSIQNVRVQKGLFEKAVIFWLLDLKYSFAALNFHGKAQSLGIRLPTAAETGGYSVTRFTIYGFGTGTIAEGDVDAVSGNLKELWELSSISHDSADLLGTWSESGVFTRNSSTGAWNYIAPAARQVAAGDFDGDGKDDLIGVWLESGTWIKYSSTDQWTLLTTPATWIAVGDFNNDGYSDLAGIWNSTLWVRDSATGRWSSVISGVTQISAGDMDGDGCDDLICTQPDKGTLIKYSATGQWSLVAPVADWIAAGDTNGDGRAELIGIWGSKLFVRGYGSDDWQTIATGATKVTAGDLDGDGKSDVVAIWPDKGVFVRYSSGDTWEKIASAADWIATGRLR